MDPKLLHRPPVSLGECDHVFGRLLSSLPSVAAVSHHEQFVTAPLQHCPDERDPAAGVVCVRGEKVRARRVGRRPHVGATKAVAQLCGSCLFAQHRLGHRKTSLYHLPTAPRELDLRGRQLQRHLDQLNLDARDQPIQLLGALFEFTDLVLELFLLAPVLLQVTPLIADRLPERRAGENRRGNQGGRERDSRTTDGRRKHR